MTRLFVCVKPFTLNTFTVYECVRTPNTVDIQIGDVFELQKSAKDVNPDNVILTYESTRFGKSRNGISCVFIEISKEHLFQHFKELKHALNYAVCTKSCTIHTLSLVGDEKDLDFEIGETITFYRNYSDTVTLHKSNSDDEKYEIRKTDFVKYFSRIYTAKP